MIIRFRVSVLLLVVCVVAQPSRTNAATLPPPATRIVDFNTDIQPLLEKHCYACHGSKKQKGAFRLDQKIAAMKGGENQDILPGHSAESPLIQRIAGLKPEDVMPPDGVALTAEQIGLFRAWIDQGAAWPEKAGVALDNRLDWWSLKPIQKPVVPNVAEADRAFVRSPIDAFIVATLRDNKLTPSIRADRRTLIRRLYFDLIGLSPTLEDVIAFEQDTSADAYEKVVDALLASPRYGERWARHWMDAVHFAETHGHDQDRVRSNAWPYRDYLISAFNADTPYARFIQEQLAADVLFPDAMQLIPALGFIAAGPWDESSLRDIREDSMCRQIGYYLDRDDMVTQTVSTFASSTVHCARCHDHKFDPISQEDYYSLQADFAGMGRADKVYDLDLHISRQRRALQTQMKAIEDRDAQQIDAQLKPLEEEFRTWLTQHRASIQKGAEWHVIAIPNSVSKEHVTLTRLDDGSLLASGLTPETDTYTLSADVALNEITGVRLELLPDDSLPHKGPGRQIDNGNLHLSEFIVQATPISKPGEIKRVAISRAAADFNQTGWSIDHAIDGKLDSAWGIFPETGKRHAAVFEFKEPVRFDGGARITCVLEQQHGRKHVIGRLRLSATATPHPAGTPELPMKIAQLLSIPDEKITPQQRTEIAATFLKGKREQQLAALPAPRLVYAGTRDFKADGTHRPLSVPRTVHVLRRGDILKPGDTAKAGALSCVQSLKSRFELADPNDEGARRAALAKWLSDPANPLVWRSIVNRIWHYHVGRGIVSTPNDFGRMGALPSHPELLDWLASEFLDSGGSIKKLQRLIVTSATYMQSSASDAQRAAVDADNRMLWRMNRSRLDAECVHDAVLQAAGRLDVSMGGPSVQNFTLSKGPHVTPVVDYSKFDWNAPGSGRRAVYRFVFRTLPDPFMDALDCADASQLTAARNVSVTPLQALALWNDAFMVHHSEVLARRIHAASGDLKNQIRALYKLALLREPTELELIKLAPFAEKYGLENLCRLVLNSSEFLFVD